MARCFELKTDRKTTIMTTKDAGYWVVVEYDAEWNKIAWHGQHANLNDAKNAMVTASLKGELK